MIIMIEEPNGNNMLNVKLSSSSVIPIPSSTSTDDLSQSLSTSEYTDADESMSAPTEYLAEFLSAVMQKDYRKALKYCKLILDFEPNNITAKEFYPLIEEKMKIMDERSSSDDENYNNVVYSPEDDEVQNVMQAASFAVNELSHHIDDNNSSSESDSEEYSAANEGTDSEERYLDVSNKSITSDNSNSETENTTHSYSNSLLEDEEDDDDYDDDNDDDDEEDVDDEDDNVGNYAVDSRADVNAVESAAAVHKVNLPDLSDLNNGNYNPMSYSDSESPTEPLTQKIAAIFRSGFSSSTGIK